jgi:predicted regulator of Ras-like GTPase activity (Roadblock/LC7/MglB family)
MIMEKIQELLKNLSKEVPGFVAGAVVEGEEGLIVVEERGVPDVDVQISAAYSVEALKFQERIISSLSNSDKARVLVSISNSYLIITQPIVNYNFYLHIITNRDKTALGIVLAILGRYEGLINKVISEWAV